MQSTLIVGGLGYIGRVIYRLLKKNNVNVDILDANIFHFLDVPSFIKCDIRDKNELEKYISKYDIIINLACLVGDPACLTNTKLATDINYFGSKNVIELSKKYKKYLIHFSTCSVYGSQFNKILTEEDEGFPIDFYGQLKFFQEKFVRETYLENSLIVRLGTVYGMSPRMRYDLVVNKFMGEAIINKEITVFGGDQERPFIHIEDIAEGIFYLANKKMKGIFNLKGENYSIKNVANTIGKYTKCKINVSTDIVDKRNYMVSNKKLEKAGYKCKYNLESFIKSVIEDNSISDIDNVVYSNVKLIQNLEYHLGLIPKLIKGDNYVDDRGILSFVNKFTGFGGIKRFYQVSNFNTHQIRAFHGHMKEYKVVYIPKGSVLFIIAKIEDPLKKILNTKYEKFVLSDRKPSLLYIPPGYVNGFRSLEEDTQIIFFSNSSLNESGNDDYRIDWDYYDKEIWNIQQR